MGRGAPTDPAGPAAGPGEAHRCLWQRCVPLGCPATAARALEAGAAFGFCPRCPAAPPPSNRVRLQEASVHRALSHQAVCRPGGLAVLLDSAGDVSDCDPCELPSICLVKLNLDIP